MAGSGVARSAATIRVASQQPPRDRQARVVRPRASTAELASSTAFGRTGGSENAEPQLPYADAPRGAVLGDVTNLANRQVWPAPPGGRACAIEKRVSKGAVPAEGMHNTGFVTGIAPTSDGAPAAGGAHDVIGLGATDTLCADVPDVEMQDIADPQEVAEYAPDIYSRLQCEESGFVPDSAYMERQPHLNSTMRNILLDWLVDVHKKYKLCQETLFLAISLVDSYLDKHVTRRNHLQLVGVTAMLIASKFEDIYPPEIKDFVYIAANAYTKEQVIQMEVKMLMVLNFKVCRPTALTFLDRYKVANKCSELHHNLAKYLLELAVTNHLFIKYEASHLAAATILLAGKLLRVRPAWSPAAATCSGLSEDRIRECAKGICNVYECAAESNLHAVRRKFKQSKYLAVANLTFKNRTPAASAPQASHRT